MGRWVSLAPAPLREPAFDDEVTQPHLVLLGREARLLPFPAGTATEHRRSASDSPPPCAPGLLGLSSAEEPPSNRGDLPDPARFGRLFVVGVMEVLSGRRPAGQLAASASVGVHAGLARDVLRGDRLGIAGLEPVVHSIRVMEPSDGVAELCATVRIGPRFRAIAARLEGIDGRWRCVRLQIG